VIELRRPSRRSFSSRKRAASTSRSKACAQAGIDAITGDTAVTRGLGEVAR
jgi:hypothetical protein